MASARPRFAAVLALAALVTGMAAPVSAQEDIARGAVPPVLTLEAALALAAEHNPEVRQARNDARAADVGVRAGWGGFMPDLSVSYGFGGGTSEQITGTDEFGRTITLDEAIVSERRSTSQGLGLSMTLFDGGASFHRLDQAQASRTAAAAAVAAAFGRVGEQVASQYWQILYARGVADLEARRLELAVEQLEATRRLLRVGARDPLDVQSAESQVASAEASVARARAAVQQSRLMLVETMGVPGVAEFELAADSFPVFDPATLDAEALVATARGRNPTLRELAARVDAAEEQTDVARSARWPSVSFGAGYGRSLGEPEFGVLFEPNPQNRSFNYNVSVSLPVFTGFQTSANIAQAEAGYRNAQEQRRAQELQVEREVRATLIELENQSEAIRLAERAAALARESVEMAQERYQVGGLSFLELQQLIQNATQAEREVLAARLAFAEALGTLERLVGGDVAPQVP